MHVIRAVCQVEKVCPTWTANDNTTCILLYVLRRAPHLAELPS